MNSEEKKALEDEAIVTDQHELINNVVDQKMQAYVICNTTEHQDLDKTLKRLEILVRGRQINAHDVVQYFLIVLLFVFMIIGIKG